jgi:UDP-glucuronate decarboxylase
VQDLIDGLVRLMASPPEFTGPVNLGNPHEFTMKELAEKVVHHTGSNVPIEHRLLPADNPRQRKPDIELAREVLPWQPRVELDQGLARTIAFFRERVEELRKPAAKPGAALTVVGAGA